MKARPVAVRRLPAWLPAALVLGLAAAQPVRAGGLSVEVWRPYDGGALNRPLVASTSATPPADSFGGMVHVEEGMTADRTTVYGRIAREADELYWNPGLGWVREPFPVATNVRDWSGGAGCYWRVLASLPGAEHMHDGYYGFSAVAIQGDKGAVSTVHRVLFDFTRPVVAITEPLSGAACTAFPICRGTVVDPAGTDAIGAAVAGSGVESLEFFLYRLSDFLVYDAVAGWTADPDARSATQPTDPAGGSWAFDMPPAAVTENESYLLVVRARDRAGNESAEQSVRFGVDRTPPPAPSILAPANNTTVPGFTAITGLANDHPGGMGIQSVTVSFLNLGNNQYWTGTGWGLETQLGAIVTTPPFRKGLSSDTRWEAAANLPPMSALVDGRYTIKARAVDRTGLAATSESTFTLNKSVPAIGFLHPGNGERAAATTFPSISGYAQAGPGASLTKVVLYIVYYGWGGTALSYWDSTQWRAQRVAIPGNGMSLSGTNWACTAALPSGAELREGNHLLEAFAVDSLGSSNRTLAIVVGDRADPLPPTVNSPAAGARLQSLPYIAGGANDSGNGAGVGEVSLLLTREDGGGGQTLYWQGMGWTSDDTDEAIRLAAPTYGTNWLFSAVPDESALPDGDYCIFATAVDLAGNRSTTTSRDFLLDRTAPIVAIAWPPPELRIAPDELTEIRGAVVDVDSLSPIRQVRCALRRETDGWFWNGAGWVFSACELNTLLVGSDWSCAGSLPGGAALPLGSYTLTVTAVDEVGNSSAIESGFTVAEANPVPVLEGLTPSTAAAGSGDLTITLAGSGFAVGASVLWNGLAGTPAFINSQGLSLTVSSNLLTTPGTITVAVVNPAPGGGQSDTRTFTITDARPANDDFANALTLTGSRAAATNFNVMATREPDEPAHAGNVGGTSLWYAWTAPDSGSVAVNTRNSAIDTLLAVYTGDSLAALASVASNDDERPGTTTSSVRFDAIAGVVYRIAVDGWNGTSGEVRLRVVMGAGLAVPPVIAWLSPAAIDQGGPDFALTVHGSSFVDTAVVRWGGVARPTSFVDEATLTAQIGAADIAVPVSAPVTVFIADDSGGTESLPSYFTVASTAPPPTITNTVPAFATAGDLDFELRILGHHFPPAAKLRWSGVDLLTWYVSVNEMRATVPAARIAAAQDVSLVLADPGSGAAVSAAYTFTVRDAAGSPLTLLARGWEGQQFKCRLVGPEGRQVVLETSADLKRWRPVCTNVLTAGQVDMLDAGCSGVPLRFYRGRLPPP